MLSLKSLLVGYLALGTATAASAVIDLIPSNFDDIVLKSGKPALVEFFAPWCGHCKTLAPIYEELGAAFAHADKKVTIAKVDADANRELGTRFGVQGFPTLKWFDGKSDKPEDYNKGRDLESLSAFVTEKTGIKIKAGKKAVSNVNLLNDRTFNQTVGTDKHVLVAFTAPWCGHCKSLKPIWETLASDYANEPTVVVAQVDAEAGDSKRITSEQGVSSYPTIKYFAPNSRDAIAYEGGRTQEAFLEYLNTHAGTFRIAGGLLSAAAGTIMSIDSAIQKVFEGGSDFAAGADSVLEAAKGVAGNKFSEYYTKVANKYKTNAGYVDKELSRLQSILKKGGLAPEKIDDLMSRSNILRKFKPVIEAVTGEKSEL